MVLHERVATYTQLQRYIGIDELTKALQRHGSTVCRHIKVMYDCIIEKIFKVIQFRDYRNISRLHGSVGMGSTQEHNRHDDLY